MGNTGVSEWTKKVIRNVPVTDLGVAVVCVLALPLG